ncbi:MAG: adenylate/guanylate cyclase domain-containing protein [Lysobacteraceae bacterium]
METIPTNTEAASRNSRAELNRLLQEMIEQPERRIELVQQIEYTFGQDRAILVLDMTGFSRTTRRFGIVSFLLMIHQMQRIACPCITAQGGVLVKTEADNLFCLFETVPAALAAAREIGRRLDAVNFVMPEERRLHASIGIGYGRVLTIEDHDLFGDEVNLTCKLSEDIAGQGAILLTDQARKRLPEATDGLMEQTVSVSGLSLTYFQVT